MNKLIILTSLIVLLTGCDERYRYPCQNPTNWSEAYCKKPICSANGTCPEDITHYLKEKAVNPQPHTVTDMKSNKGDCK